MASFTAALLGVALLSFGSSPAPRAGTATEIDELLAQLSSRHWEPAVDRLVEIGPPAIQPLLAVARETGHAGSRACETLVRIGTAPAIEAVWDIARSDDGRLRRRAVAALGFDSSEESRPVDGLPLYPETLVSQPEIPSPATIADSRVVVVALTAEGRWAVVPAAPLDDSRAERQRRVDAHDFPTLARTGLHSEAELQSLATITGRSLAEITDLGRPDGLSTEGFLGADEDILSVLLGDNRLVSALALTHPQMARPLFHVWNMVEADVEAGRWNTARHRWDRIRQVLYNDRRVDLEVHDTKGGQESIFADGLGGAFHIKIRRVLTPEEEELLRREYAHLPPPRWETLVQKLTTIETGEMEPHYIQWYGFYEGHTAWRADPVAIAFIFGLRTLEEIEEALPRRIDEVLTRHFTRSAVLQ